MNSTTTAPAASTSRLPPPVLPPPTRPPPSLQPPARSGKRSSKRLSGNSGNTSTHLNSSSSKSNKKQKPSLSHVINHLKDSPPAHLTSFLSLDSATTPMTAASTSYSHHHHYQQQQQHSQIQTPLTAASSNSNYPYPYPNPHARAMSPMTLMELPPLRMEGLTRESVFVDQALSSASSYTVTPIWELSESSGSATMKGLGSNLKRDSPSGSASEGATPTTPPTSAGTAAAPPSPSPSPDTNADNILPKPRLDLDFGLGEGDELFEEWNSSPSRAQTPFNSPSSKANSGSQQPFITSTLFPTTTKPEGESESNPAVPASTTTTTSSTSLAFLEEVDRWLAYIEKNLSQLERRHLRLNVA